MSAQVDPEQDSLGAKPGLDHARSARSLRACRQPCAQSERQGIRPAASASASPAKPPRLPACGLRAMALRGGPCALEGLQLLPASN